MVYYVAYCYHVGHFLKLVTFLPASKVCWKYCEHCKGCPRHMILIGKKNAQKGNFAKTTDKISNID